MKRFVDVFNKIHSIELQNSVGLIESNKYRLDEKDLRELETMSTVATSTLKGLVGGASAGALTAAGAYGAAMTFGAASTGTAIASLTGIAAQNATLAFLGGGALAAGGGGIALGTTILGGVVAGPAIAILGAVLSASADENYYKARSQREEAKKLAEELKTVSSLCRGIQSRSNMFTSLLKDLDKVFSKLVCDLESIVTKSGCNYTTYTDKEKNTVAMALSMAGAIKSVLDTAILTKEGKLTSESEKVHTEASKALKKMSLSQDYQSSRVNTNVRTVSDKNFVMAVEDIYGAYEPSILGQILRGEICKGDTVVITRDNKVVAFSPVKSICRDGVYRAKANKDERIRIVLAGIKKDIIRKGDQIEILNVKENTDTLEEMAQEENEPCSATILEELQKCKEAR